MRPYRLSATLRGSRQVAAHQKCVQLFPVCLPVIAFAAPHHGKSGPLVEPPRRLIVFLDLEEDAAHAAAGEMAEMRQQQVARQAAAAMAGDRRRSTGFRPRPPPSAIPQNRSPCAPVSADEPACCARAAWPRIRLRPSRGETRRRAVAPDAPRRAGSRARPPGAAAPPFRQPGTYSAHHGADGCAVCCNGSLEGFASGARR